MRKDGRHTDDALHHLSESERTKFRSPAKNTTLNPIRERSGRLDSTQDGRKTSRSQEIDVNSFCEEPSFSERTGRPVETSVNPTRSSEDRKDFNVEQTRERTGRLVNTHDVTNVTDSSQTLFLTSGMKCTKQTRAQHLTLKSSSEI